MVQDPKNLREDLCVLLNRHGVEQAGGDTPDYLLADYLIACLGAFGAAIRRREAHFGRDGRRVYEASEVRDAADWATLWKGDNKPMIATYPGLDRPVNVRDWPPYILPPDPRK